MEKSQIYLKTPIGSGGEADIYEVHLRPNWVAKIYYKPNSVVCLHVCCFFLPDFCKKI